MKLNPCLFLISVFIIQVLFNPGLRSQNLDTLESQTSETDTFTHFTNDLSPENIISSSQMVKYWILQNREKIRKSLDRMKKTDQQFTYNGFPYIYGSRFHYSDELKLDYRQSSLYIPKIVRDYLDFKMGRDPFLPIMGTGPSNLIGNPIWYYIYMSSMRKQ